MLMPKTAVNKYRLLIRAPHDIWFSSEFFGMCTEPVPQLMNKRPHEEFGFHILRTNAPHVV
jgi:hypothetical protein